MTSRCESVQMSKAQTLRALVNQRLRAAAEEICELLERTVAEVEEDCRRQQQRLLKAAYQPRVRLHRADVQLLLASQEVKWTSSQDQEDPPEPPHSKEEEDEVWTGLQGEQHGGLQELTVPPADEEKPQLSELQQNLTEHLKTEEVRQDCGELEPARDPDPDPPTGAKTSHCESDTDDSLNWEETSEVQLGFKLLQNHQVPAVDQECNTGETSASSSGCAADSGQAGQDPSGFTCPVCRKQFEQKKYLVRHMPVHTGEKAYCCSTCGRCFAYSSSLTFHKRVHTGEKPYSCSVCKASFRISSNLAKHRRIHTKPFGCSTCGRTFAQKIDLTNHERVHTGQKPFCCALCGKRFTFRNSLAVHSKIHSGEKPFSCSTCGVKFLRRSELVRHEYIHTGQKPFSCDHCPKRFTRRCHLTKHSKIHIREKPFSCTTCVKRYRQKSGLDYHLKVHPEHKPFKEESQQQQPEVQLHRADVQQLLASQEVKWTPSQDQEDPPEPPHIKEEEDEVWTGLQGEQHGGLQELTVPPADEEKPQLSELQQNLTEHLKTEEVRQDCGEPEPARDPDPDPETLLFPHIDSDEIDSLDWEETSEAQLGLKLLQNHQVPAVDQECNTGETSASSSGCAADSGHAGQDPSGCSGSDKTNQQKKSSGPKCKSNSEKSPWSCSICKKKFKQKPNMVTHMRIHTGEKPFSCSFCDKKFTTNACLNSHVRVHTGERPFSCSFCDKKFAHSTNLTSHIRIHTGEKPFSCSFCGKSFAYWKTLTGHVRVHTGAKPYSCSICNARFRRASNLSQHMKHHSGNKPFSCTTCGKGFLARTNLAEHLRVHSGEKPFSCSTCGRKYTQKSSLNQHLKAHPECAEANVAEVSST